MLLILTLGASWMLSGCATYGLWSGHSQTDAEKVVARNSAITEAYHSTSMDRIYFRFKAEQ